jgi:hypothetical protein
MRAVSRQALREIVAPLPWTMREQIEDYVRTVAEAAPAIFDEADLPLTPGDLDRFLYAAGIRKLWNLVESQYVLLSSALGLVEPYGVEQIDVGRRSFSRASETYTEIRELRNGLYRQLVRLELFPVAAARTLADVAFLTASPSSRR